MTLLILLARRFRTPQPRRRSGDRVVQLAAGHGWALTWHRAGDTVALALRRGPDPDPQHAAPNGDPR